MLHGKRGCMILNVVVVEWGFGVEEFSNIRFAYIDFERTESLYSAIKLHGKALMGREIRVDVESRKARVGYKLPKDQDSRYSKQ